MLVLAVAAVAALWPRESHPRSDSIPATAAEPRQRAAAGLADCPTPGAATAPDSPLRDITVTCLATGRPLAPAAALAGKPALLNLWAYWCQPCARELPVLRDYADRAGSAVTVLTVHSDPDEAKGVARLADLGVRLPSVQDTHGRIAAALGVPAALPMSVLLRPDGTVAKVVVGPFRDIDDIASTVRRELGVAS